ncbi:MAG: wax ester/triacylglycerol synthase family O-acyltransferase [Deltaproteobacteria bacterium]|nr:wax ester/triacylglycerol synthase family O-acyltransferase [Deltaproteobacteria bacterium]MBI3387885.1 wax ester/triacylglycerol synthase family O-acyltransferase [Deltaproteobacteria bacterium]
MLPTDAFFWYAEAATPHLRPLVAGIFALDQAPDRRRFRAAMERLVAHVPRLHHRVVEALAIGLPEWVDDPAFDLDYHLRSIILPPPANQRHLFDFAGAVFATPLDHLRPLWEAYLIEGLEHDRAALFIKMHHSVMDGAGAVALFDAMTQAGRSEPIRVPHRAEAPPTSGARSPVLARQIRAVVRAAAGVVAAASRSVVRALNDPLPAIDEMVRTAGRVGDLLRDMTVPPLADPLAARCTGIGRRLDGTTFSLPRLRRIKDALGGTLNDLVLTTVAGALGRYHRDLGIRMEEVACVVPMSLRQDHESHTLGNRVGAFNVMLPVGLRNPLARLARIRAQTKLSKGNGKSASYQALMQAIALVPAAGFRFLARQASGRIHLICSNVPGPSVQRYLAGAKIDGVYAFAPVMLGTPIAIALVSYGDSVGVGIDADPAAIPDPERIRQHLETELDEIERRISSRARPTMHALQLVDSRARRPARRKQPAAAVMAASPAHNEPKMAAMAPAMIPEERRATS